ncbi:uncharacterized protein BP5553_03157 [Venustampulla echinocandica]|uniref:mannan endo-1,6-alpha-mannosidase n=1 Tax=Venustampulla echinocandica TaxID=2656787 RepID=A0A370TTF5_9HELO|nr:uncharacterized protein BP5553_03157 [Venustampulla echinocandica]RDL38817.1 hypothetical protein BP5553_03157 [Venustampulla echinocandica]
MRGLLGAAAALLAATAQCVSAVRLDVTNANSIKESARTIAHGMMTYYSGNVTNTPQTIGVLPPPYYWWEAGAMWGALMDYYHFTGDASYNKVLTEALMSQVGPNWDFMVPLHQKDEGNDDQAFWGFAVMSAAEKGFPQPQGSQYSWVQLVERLWNTQVQRWGTDHCGGGLRWQIFESNNGYNYKNTVSNGAFFQLSARLARFTGNQTYVEWADKSYNWAADLGLITDEYHVFDGADVLKNCTSLTKIMWTYNAGIYLYGSAMMYNHTNGAGAWKQRTQGFLDASTKFFSPFDNATSVMYEPACETVNRCNTDQYSFKAYLSRFMWASTLIAPFTTSTVNSLLTKSAQAAATACSGPTDGVTCGARWYVGGFDGTFGVGQQMSALETIQGLLVSGTVPPMVGGQQKIVPPSQGVENSKSAEAPTISASTAVPNTPEQSPKSVPSSVVPDTPEQSPKSVPSSVVPDTPEQSPKSVPSSVVVTTAVTTICPSSVVSPVAPSVASPIAPSVASPVAPSVASSDAPPAAPPTESPIASSTASPIPSSVAAPSVPSASSGSDSAETPGSVASVVAPATLVPSPIATSILIDSSTGPSPHVPSISLVASPAASPAASNVTFQSGGSESLGQRPTELLLISFGMAVLMLR